MLLKTSVTQLSSSALKKSHPDYSSTNGSISCLNTVFPVVDQSLKYFLATPTLMKLNCSVFTENYSPLYVEDMDLSSI